MALILADPDPRKSSAARTRSVFTLFGLYAVSLEVVAFPAGKIYPGRDPVKEYFGS
ncbi:uncharacterized protein BO97DRAFT_405573, partial [Aspergillus homomorphus CBS 101889]